MHRKTGSRTLAEETISHATNAWNGSARRSKVAG